MNTFAKKEVNMILLLIGILFLLGGCSTNINQNNIDGKPEITASVIEDTKENCRLTNESDCRPIEIRRGEGENEETNNTEEAASAGGPSNKTINLSEKILLSDCREGWKCVEKNYRAYQYTNCSWISIEYCIYGCKNGTCKPSPICKSNSLKCDNDNVVKCNEDGSEWEKNESCDYKCENGICIGKTNTTTQNVTQPQPPQNNYIKDKCVNVSRYNLTGINATDEYFTLNNSCPYQIDMSGWTAGDNVKNHTYTFPSFNLVSNGDVTIVTGAGSDSSKTLYWGKNIAVWNNGGDTLYLNASNGTSVLIKYLTP